MNFHKFIPIIQLYFSLFLTNAVTSLIPFIYLLYSIQRNYLLVPFPKAILNNLNIYEPFHIVKIVAKLLQFLQLILMVHSFDPRKFLPKLKYNEDQEEFLVLCGDFQKTHHMSIFHKIFHKDSLI